MLRLICQEQFAVHRFVRPQLREINHSSAIWLFSFFVLACVLHCIGILGEVNQIHVLVDNQRTCGAKIAGFDLLI